MKETILKILNLWQLGKVLCAATVVWFEIVYVYFKSTVVYNALMTVLKSFNEGQVIITMTREEYERMEAYASTKDLEDEQEE